MPPGRCRTPVLPAASLSADHTHGAPRNNRLGPLFLEPVEALSRKFLSDASSESSCSLSISSVRGRPSGLPCSSKLGNGSNLPFGGVGSCARHGPCYSRTSNVSTWTHRSLRANCWFFRVRSFFPLDSAVPLWYLYGGICVGARRLPQEQVWQGEGRQGHGGPFSRLGPVPAARCPTLHERNISWRRSTEQRRER